MSTTTANLGLFKYVLPDDANVPFKITDALNNNWDKIDNFSQNINALPDQTGKTDCLLSTDGSSAFWSGVQEVFPIIEFSFDNTTEDWYIVYSNGWCEQGSKYTDVTVTSATIPFVKPFINTKISINAQSVIATSTDTGGETSSLISNVSLLNFRISKVKTHMISWQACGYVEV